MSTTGDVNQTNIPAPAQAPAPELDTVSVSRSDYDQMQEQLAQARATFEALNPHAARLERLVKDPRAGELFDNALTAYQQFEERSKPAVPSEMQPVYEKVSKLEKFVDDFEARRKDEEERPQREAQQRYVNWQNDAQNNRFFQRLMTDHPTLKPRDISYLAQVAAENNFEPLEAVWKTESWRFDKPGVAAPPSSQRADAGEVGSAPAPTTAQGPTMRERIIELERARRSGMAS